MPKTRWVINNRSSLLEVLREQELAIQSLVRAPLLVHRWLFSLCVSFQGWRQRISLRSFMKATSLIHEGDIFMIASSSDFPPLDNITGWQDLNIRI